MSQDSDCDNQNRSALATPANGSQMSFKDWKMQKEVVDSKNEPQKRKPGRFNKTTLPSLLSLNFDQNAFCSSGQPSTFMVGVPPNDNFNNPNFNRVGQFNGNGYSSGMHFNTQNGMNFNNQNSGTNFNGQNFNNGVYRGCGYRTNAGYNKSFPDNFFNTDGFYPQKDMIEETIADNPFRHNSRAQQLLNEFKYMKNQNMSSEKKKPAANKPRPDARKENDKTATTSETSTTPPMMEPKIFIKNPRKESNKPYIPMPKPPETEITGTLEERKQQWKDYREAMKPFKNREFYNAKRVVQRLGKKDPRELDEKDQFRLSNAQEKMAQHKQKLSEKYDHYIQSPHNPSTSTSGELFVLKRGNQSQWSSASKSNPEQFQNYGNFGESLSTNSANSFGHGFSSSSGRKILGGPSKYSSFVSGGSLESTLTTQY